MNFTKVNLRTLSEVELFETFPRKVYNVDYLTLKEAGISKNQILIVKILK
jgi:hypothetical protein